MSILVNHKLIDPVFHPYYQAVLDYASSQGYCLPSRRVQILQNQFVISRVTSGAWALTQLMYVFAGDSCNMDFKRINWINPSSNYLAYTATLTDNGNDGIKGNGGSCQFNTGYNPNAHGGLWTLNSAGYQIQIKENTQAATDELGYSGAVSASPFVMRTRDGTDRNQLALNSSQVQQATLNSSGYWQCDRQDSATCFLYRDTVNHSNITGSVVLPNSSLTIFRSRSSSSRTIRMVAFGGNQFSLIASNYANWNTYFNAL